MPTAEPQTALESDDLEWELVELVEEHGSERAALRALLHDFHMLLADADRSVSRGFLRGAFSAGARPLTTDEEP